MENTQQLVRVYSDHLPLPVVNGGRVWPPKCRACGEDWPCHTYQRNLQGQTGNRRDQMRAHMTVPYLRAMSRPELAFIEPEVHAVLLGWIDKAVSAQLALESATDRARRATLTATTGAQRAIARASANIVSASRKARNWLNSRITDGTGRGVPMGQPARYEVRYEDVYDDETVRAAR